MKQILCPRLVCLVWSLAIVSAASVDDSGERNTSDASDNAVKDSKKVDDEQSAQQTNANEHIPSVHGTRNFPAPVEADDNGPLQGRGMRRGGGRYGGGSSPYGGRFRRNSWFGNGYGGEPGYGGNPAGRFGNGFGKNFGQQPYPGGRFGGNGYFGGGYGNGVVQYPSAGRFGYGGGYDLGRYNGNYGQFPGAGFQQPYASPYFRDYNSESSDAPQSVAAR